MIYLIVVIAILIPFYLLYLLIKAGNKESQSLEDYKSVIESPKELQINIPRNKPKNLPIHKSEDIIIEELCLFELHLTTERRLNDSEIKDFSKLCEELSSKAIIIEVSKGLRTQQPMLTKKMKTLSRNELRWTVKNLTEAMSKAKFKCERVKIEVPLEDEEKSKLLYSYSSNSYYEWHGKILCSDSDLLNLKLPRIRGVHLSKNSLKNEPNTRFLTVRSSAEKKIFLEEVSELKNKLDKWIESGEITLRKEEYEYCVFDSKDVIDYEWLHPFREGAKYFGNEVYSPEFLKIKDRPDNLKVLLYEAFLIRTTFVDKEFVLKGSLLTRQEIEDKTDRAPGDLDFLYLGKEKDPDKVGVIFTEWLEEVMYIGVDDFCGFQMDGDHFWWGIDYAMDDDFPTTGTSITGHFHHHHEDINIDITWNLPSNFEPISKMYTTESGDKFLLKKSIPVPVQIAWKLHQTIIRPRSKDLIDIVLLLRANKLNKQEIELLVNVFKEECNHGDIDSNRILLFTSGRISEVLTGLKSGAYGNSELRNSYMIDSIGFSLFDLDLKNINQGFLERASYKHIAALIKDFNFELITQGIVEKITKL